MEYKKLLLISVAIAMTVSAATVRAAHEVEIPFELARGQMIYEKYCTSCHGAHLDGTDQGPPLLHPFYKPSHHGDKSFYRAVLQGSKQHHWNFGDMKPVEGMTPKKVDSVVPYVRFYQKQKKLF